MPVLLKIQDGPTSAPWLSAAVVPGTLQVSTQAFTPAGASLTKGQSYDFRIEVTNDGNQETTPPAGAGPTGAFVAPALTTGTATGLSPSGTSQIQLTGPVGLRQVALQTAAGAPLRAYDFENRTIGWGYSSDGRYLVISWLSTGLIAVEFKVVACEAIGSGAGALAAGTEVYSTSFTPTGGWAQHASAGHGFFPGNNQLFITWTELINVAFRVIDLRPAVANRVRIDKTVSQRQFGQVRMSPSGDLLVLIGQPASSGFSAEDVDLYDTSTGQIFPARRRGMAVGTPSVSAPPVTLNQVRPAGFEAIRLEGSSLGAGALIDSPTISPPAVAVHLWVDSTTTVLNPTTARHYPGGMALTTAAPSAFIDRIGPTGTTAAKRLAFVDANWLAVAPPPGAHFCAIAEAFTTAGTTPSDPQQRPATGLLDASLRQIAQRNLVVV